MVNLARATVMKFASVGSSRLKRLPMLAFQRARLIVKNKARKQQGSQPKSTSQRSRLSSPPIFQPFETFPAAFGLARIVGENRIVSNLGWCRIAG